MINVFLCVKRVQWRSDNKIGLSWIIVLIIDNNYNFHYQLIILTLLLLPLSSMREKRERERRNTKKTEGWKNAKNFVWLTKLLKSFIKKLLGERGCVRFLFIFHTSLFILSPFLILYLWGGAYICASNFCSCVYARQRKISVG